LWIGTNKGIFTIAKPSDNIVAVEIESDLRNVSSIVIDFKKRIWVGTNEGLGCYENGKWNILRKSDGLTSNLITSLVLNKDSVLWIGTYDRGISTLNLKSYPLQNRLIKNSKKSNHLLSKYQIHFGNRKMLLENRNNFLLNGRKSSAVLSGRPTTNIYILNRD
jgi:ligand-binding sensor domain-containing protein